MPRPRSDERCSVCIDEMRECRAEDLSDIPGDPRTHLQFMYDRQYLKASMGGMDHETFSHALEVYALNRYLAPFRDNRNKAEGKKAERTYKSRNVKTSETIDKKCDVWRGPMRCMRNAGHPADDRDNKGSHKF